jgi:hypothetical protein
MSGFDAELYLRLMGERTVLAGPDPQRGDGTSPLTMAAQALVAVGCVDDATAVAVLEDYVLAGALRGDFMSLHSLSDDDDEETVPESVVEPLTPGRVVACDETIELAAGTLRVSHVTLGRDVTTLAVDLRLATPRSHRRGHPMRSGLPSVTLADDRGTRTSAQLSGGGSESHWEGHFHAEPGLHVDTAFIEVDGHRIELEGEIEPIEPWIEELPEQDPALRHLWQCVTPEGHMHEQSAVEPAIDALVAAGVLTGDEPELADVRAVAGALPHGVMFGVQAANTNALPEPWRSVVRGSRGRGPDGTVAVRAATPVFDGFAVAVSAVLSGEEGWSAEVEVAPGLEMFSPFAGPRPRSRPLTWWAADDRGHHYLGGIGGWSGGETGARGTIQFSSALDPKATYVDLLPTATTRRAVIRVPLVWS